MPEERVKVSASPTSVAAAIKGVRRARRRVRRASQEAVETLATQILAHAGRPADTQPSNLFTIDELAVRAGTTSRNVRVYRERGLLAEPLRAGRRSLYDDEHLDRLKLIVSLLKRGFNVSHISDLLAAADEGQHVSEFLGGGFPQPEVERWLPDASSTLTVSEAVELVQTEAALKLLASHGIVQFSGKYVTLLRPSLLDAFVEAHSMGLAWETILDVHDQVTQSIDKISHVLVGAGIARVSDILMSDATAFDKPAANLGRIVYRLRILSIETAVESLRVSIDSTIRSMLTGAIAGAISHHSLTDDDETDP